MNKLLICFLLVLSGCASHTFSHPYKSAEQFENDKWDCMEVAEQRADGNVFLTTQYLRECLVHRHGWKVET